MIFFFAFSFPQFSFHQGLLVQLAGIQLVFFFLMSGMMNTKTPGAEVHWKKLGFYTAGHDKRFWKVFSRGGMGWLFFRGYGSGRKGRGLAFAGRNRNKALGDLILGIYLILNDHPVRFPSASPGDRIIFGVAYPPPCVLCQVLPRHYLYSLHSSSSSRIEALDPCTTNW